MELNPTEYSSAGHCGIPDPRCASSAGCREDGIVAEAQADIPVAFGDRATHRAMPHEPGGKCVEIHHARAGRDLGRAAGEALVYRVSDTGIGIPQHQLESIFVEFQQADSNHHPRIAADRTRAQHHQEVRRDAETHLGGEWGVAGFHILLLDSLAPRDKANWHERQNALYFTFWFISVVAGGDRLSFTVTSISSRLPRLFARAEGYICPGERYRERTPLVVRDRMKGCSATTNPGPHPGVEVAVHPDNFRVS